MKPQLVRHSNQALKRYMADMSLSADDLTRLTKIAESKIHKALNGENVLRLSQLEKIAKVLFVPTVYLTTDHFIFQRDSPQVIEHRNQEDISENEYRYRALIEEFSQVRQSYISVKEAMDEELEKFDLKLSGDINNAESDAKTIIDYFGFHSFQKKIKIMMTIIILGGNWLRIKRYWLLIKGQKNLALMVCACTMKPYQ
ncbi:helix-turn-helix transcriptional regulator [Acinetobacter sp. UGAL515B_02]|nr:helix-turn-helix transcriptional regulator [Acinetobacter sp. UGAL515B_02]WON79106.1 helix-turn-helix transcriptional regulator [Acinetobacter sp. UGAL515B_02]